MAQGFENVGLDTSMYASGLAGSAGTDGAGGSGAPEQRMPASRNQPRVEQAAPGGSASSRNIPMSGGARPPRLAASRLQHALPAPGVACGGEHMLRLCVSRVV